MNVLIIPSTENLIKEVSLHLLETNRDYSSNLIIFPGIRPSYFLRKALAENIKGSFIPPVIYSIDNFIDAIFEPIESKKKLETIDAIAILYEIHKNNPIGENNFLTFDRFFPIGLKIYKDLEELYINCIDDLKVKEIQSFIDNAVSKHEASTLQSLFFFYREFYKEIQRLNLSTRSTRYRVVSEKLDETLISRFTRIIVAGFFAFTESEKKIFKKLLSLKKTMFIFQDGPFVKENLIDIGIKLNDKETYIYDISDKNINFYSSPDIHGEVYAVGNILKEILNNEKKIDENTVIVIPSSDTLFPLLRQGLSFLDPKEFNVSLGYPLFRTPIFAFLNSLMDLISSKDGSKFYVPDYLKFVLHPYTKNIFFDGSAEMTRILFHTIETHLTKHKTKTFLELSEIEEDTKMFSDFLKNDYFKQNITTNIELISDHLKYIHDNTIRKFLAFENIGDFAKKCSEVLTFIYNCSTAKLHPFFHPYAESTLIALDALSKSLINSMAFSNISNYFSFIRKYLITYYVPFEGNSIRGLQVLGFLETRNLKFKRLLILDTNEEILPASKEESLLPFQVRQMLGLPTYIERDKITAYYFENLIRGADEIHLFFVENEAKERSRFVERLIWEKQKKDRTLDSNRYIKSIQYKIRLSYKTPSAIIKTKDIVNFLKEFTYSPTAIDTYLKCGLKFYYSYVLGIEEKEKSSGEIEREDIGKFVHRCISAFFSTKKGYTLTYKDIDIDEMDHYVDKFFAEDYGNEPIGAIYLLKYQIKSRMRDILKKYYIPLIGNKELIILENEYKINTSEGNFNIAGRIDSIEKRGNIITIIDYKTGSSPNHLRINFNKLNPDKRSTWSEAIGSLQLPFYILLYQRHTDTDIKDIDAMFLLLGRSSISRDIELPLFESKDKQITYELLRGIIVSLLEEIINPKMPFSPTTDYKKECPNCAFRFMCGMQWMVRNQS